jgi:hypothetical protein
MKLNKNPSPEEVRRFAFVWMFVAAAMASLLFWRHHTVGAKILWAASGVVGISGMAIPSIAKTFYRIWMSLAFAINWIITHLLLGLIFWLVLTPIALLFKVTGRDALRLKKLPSGQESYWLDHDRVEDLTSYKHLY